MSVERDVERRVRDVGRRSASLPNRRVRPTARALAIEDPHGVIAVRCASCGWDSDGRLELVNHYTLAWPPGPMGDVDNWLEVRDDDDPECRRTLEECPRCEAALDPYTVVPRHREEG